MSGLANSYVHNLASKFKINKYRGVFSADKFPVGGRGSFIVNTHPSSEPGEHFIVILRRRRKYFYFNPLGLTLNEYPSVLSRIKQSSAKKKYYPALVKPVQSPFSDFCGFFCVFFLVHLDQ